MYIETRSGGFSPSCVICLLPLHWQGQPPLLILYCKCGFATWN
jgi:hypothetical protein